MKKKMKPLSPERSHREKAGGLRILSPSLECVLGFRGSENREGETCNKNPSNDVVSLSHHPARRRFGLCQNNSIIFLFFFTSNIT